MSNSGAICCQPRTVHYLLSSPTQVRWLVLDEADRLFEMGYEKDVQKIVDVLNANGIVTPPAAAAQPTGNPFAKRDLTKIVVKPRLASETPTALLPDGEADAAAAGAEPGTTPQPTKLQSMLLSATLTASVRQLAGLALKNPLFIDTTDVNAADIQRTNTFAAAVDEAVADEKISIPATVSQSYVLVPPKLRLVTLAGLVAVEAQRAAGATKMLVFMGSEQMVEFHYDVMNEALTRKVLDSDDEDVQSDESGDDEVRMIGKKKRKGEKVTVKALEDYDNDRGDGEEPYLKGVRFFK